MSLMVRLQKTPSARNSTLTVAYVDEELEDASLNLRVLSVTWDHFKPMISFLHCTRGEWTSYEHEWKSLRVSRGTSLGKYKGEEGGAGGENLLTYNIPPVYLLK